MTMTSAPPNGAEMTIFTEMTALANRTGAINLGQGFPGRDGPPPMLAATQEAISNGHNQYPPLIGVPALREEIAAQRARRYGTRYDPADEVLVTVGATEAITAAVMALCQPGDEVVVFEPYYDSYAAALTMARGSAQRAAAAERERFCFRRSRATRRGRAKDAAVTSQYPTQPDGQDIHQGGVGLHRQGVPEARPARDR